MTIDLPPLIWGPNIFKQRLFPRLTDLQLGRSQL